MKIPCGRNTHNNSTTCRRLIVFLFICFDINIYRKLYAPQFRDKTQGINIGGDMHNLEQKMNLK